MRKIYKARLFKKITFLAVALMVMLTLGTTLVSAVEDVTKAGHVFTKNIKDNNDDKGHTYWRFGSTVNFQHPDKVKDANTFLHVETYLDGQKMKDAYSKIEYRREWYEEFPKETFITIADDFYKLDKLEIIDADGVLEQSIDNSSKSKEITKYITVGEKTSGKDTPIVSASKTLRVYISTNEVPAIKNVDRVPSYPNWARNAEFGSPVNTFNGYEIPGYKGKGNPGNWLWESTGEMMGVGEIPLSLGTDAQGYVWDNGKYSTKSNKPTDGIEYAKWGEQSGAHEYEVRRFQTKYEIPEGYDGDDFFTMRSVNQDMYKSIANDGNIMPIDDNMYVFVYPEDMWGEITNDNYMEYFVFWTGTEYQGNVKQPYFREYGSERCYTFEDTQDLNLNHTNGLYSVATIGNIGKTMEDGKSGDKYIIDIFTENYTSDGGMDRLEIVAEKKPAVKVEFNSNGGTPISLKLIGFNETIEEPNIPTKEGYTFGGWYNEQMLETKWDFERDTVKTDITLYAEWLKNDSLLTVWHQGMDEVLGGSEGWIENKDKSLSLPEGTHVPYTKADIQKIAEDKLAEYIAANNGIVDMKYNGSFKLIQQIFDGSGDKIWKTYYDSSKQDDEANINKLTTKNNLQTRFHILYEKAKTITVKYFKEKSDGTFEEIVIPEEDVNKITLKFRGDKIPVQENAPVNGEYIDTDKYLPIGYSFSKVLTSNNKDIVNPYVVGIKDETINVYYTLNTGISYTVEYETADGTKLSADKVVENQRMSTIVTADAKDIPGYTPDMNSKSLKLEAEDNVITFIYTINDYTLTINYEYEDGAVAADQYAETLKFNSNYRVESPYILGYTVDNTIVSGVMLAEDVTITVTYRLDSNQRFPVKVKYFDIDTDEELLTPMTGEAPIGSVLDHTATIFTADGTQDVKQNISGFRYKDSTSSIIVDADTDTNVIELYYRPVYEVKVIADTKKAGIVSGQGEYERGEFATLNAVANRGYEFAGWQKDGVAYKTTSTGINAFDIQVKEAMEFVAKFNSTSKDNNVFVNHLVKIGGDSNSQAGYTLEATESYLETESGTILAENYMNHAIIGSGYKFVWGDPEEIDIFSTSSSGSAITTSGSAIRSKVNNTHELSLYYYKDLESDPGPTPNPVPDRPTRPRPTRPNPDDIIEIIEEEVPLAQLEKEDHFAYVIGYIDGTVRPENNITREEVAMIFYRLLTDDNRLQMMSDTNSFNDMTEDRWSNRAISTLYNCGVIQGYEDGSFKPSAPISRAEFAAMSAKFDALELTNESKFTDTSGHWAEKYINSSESKGWIKGYDDNTFKPNKNITRSEAMTLINNVLGRIILKENISTDAIQWSDNEINAWYYENVMEATNSHDYMRDEAQIELWTGIKENKIWP